MHWPDPTNKANGKQADTREGNVTENGQAPKQTMDRSETDACTLGTETEDNGRHTNRQMGTEKYSIAKRMNEKEL